MCKSLEGVKMVIRGRMNRGRGKEWNEESGLNRRGEELQDNQKYSKGGWGQEKPIKKEEKTVGRWGYNIKGKRIRVRQRFAYQILEQKNVQKFSEKDTKGGGRDTGTGKNEDKQ